LGNALGFQHFSVPPEADVEIESLQLQKLPPEPSSATRCERSCLNARAILRQEDRLAKRALQAAALVADQGFAQNVEAMLETDLEHCEPVQRNQFDEKPLPFRAAARIARLASPLL
jgi:hypothetical protein